MNYYLIEITQMIDGTTVQSIYEKIDLDTAIMDFHMSIASAMANTSVAHATRLVIDFNGISYRSERYDRKDIEPDPEPIEE